jgi:hypothetical protein
MGWSKEVLKAGTGPNKPTPGGLVTVHCTGAHARARVDNAASVCARHYPDRSEPCVQACDVWLRGVVGDRCSSCSIELITASPLPSRDSAAVQQEVLEYQGLERRAPVRPPVLLLSAASQGRSYHGESLPFPAQRCTVGPGPAAIQLHHRSRRGHPWLGRVSGGRTTLRVGGPRP